MMVIRPITSADFAALVRFAHESGHGFTSLPKHDEHLRTRIERAEAAFSDSSRNTGEAGYLFVMENSATGEVVGTSGIEARVGLNDALYHYHLSKVVHASRELGIHNTVDVLTLCNDYTGATEICTLFLTESARARSNGNLLSRFRFLFMAQHPELFADIVIAEMRGVSDDAGRSPFWGWLQKHFFSMDLADAVHRVGMGQKSIIADLMPRYPIYVSLLDQAAQKVIGEVHELTMPALKMLQREGFQWGGYVDPFDAGPTVSARRDAIRTVAGSEGFSVRVVDQLRDKSREMLIANTGRGEFRATLMPARIGADDRIELTADTATALRVDNGSPVRAITVQE